jgi:hypothetical protein
MSFNPIGTISGWLGQQVPGQPGVGSVNPNDAQFAVPVPGAPGVYVDSRTGQQFVGHPGNPQTIQAQNLNNQTVTNATNEGVAQAAAAKLAAQQQQTFAGQNQLATSLNNTINNPNAPSVANTQLAQGLNSITGTQEATAAGASGENAAAARRTAAQDIAGAGTVLNGQQSLLRANEVQGAQTGLSSLYNSQLGAEGQGVATNTTSANNYANTEEKAQGDVVGANSTANQANAKANSSLLGTFGNGLAALAG